MDCAEPSTELDKALEAQLLRCREIRIKKATEGIKASLMRRRDSVELFLIHYHAAKPSNT